MYEIFAELLKTHNVTRYQVSKATGVPQSSLSDWSKGKSKPKYENMKRIADYFGVSVDYLLGNEEKPAAPKDSELDELVKDELVGFYGDVKKELTPGDIEDIKTLMKIRAELNRQKGK